ncbi:MAG: cardiolipin synthase [Flavobacteriales bacterium]|nr:MAG: cardiolipin synthase [Flavobacteriales bacterium]
MEKILILLYALITLWALFSIIMHGTRPSHSLSWVFTVLVFPFLGPMLYYLFGVNRRKFKFNRLRGNLKRKLYDETYPESQVKDFGTRFNPKRGVKLATLIKNSAQFYPYTGNRVMVLNTGKETFDQIFKAIKGAKKFIHIQYYIFEEGELLDQFHQLFKEKIKEGVEVRIIYDSLGSHSFRGKLKKRFRNIGARTYPMMPLRLGTFMYTLNYRNHRKIVVVDGKVGFVGGVNVSNKYIKPISELGLWADLHLQLEGPVVSSLHRIFIKDYYFASKKSVLLRPKYLPELPEMGNSIVQMVASGPDSREPTILQQYVGMINLAKKRICIANPYFIPGNTLLQAIEIASLSGIEVVLLVPEKSDSLLAKYGMYGAFEKLMSVGVKIYLRDDFSHSKVIMIDDQIVSVGTGNFDYRSFEHNFECNEIIYDPQVAKVIKQEFTQECKEAISLDYEIFRKRAMGQKFLEGLARFLSPLL